MEEGAGLGNVVVPGLGVLVVVFMTPPDKARSDSVGYHSDTVSGVLGPHDLSII